MIYNYQRELAKPYIMWAPEWPLTLQTHFLLSRDHIDPFASGLYVPMSLFYGGKSY